MTKEDFERFNNIEKIKEKIIEAEDLKPFLKDRTLLYGYTNERKTFHVYMKNVKIHTVIYDTDFNNGIQKPINMMEVEIKSNHDYVPNKRLYPECCDYHFCKLLKNIGIELPFTTYQEERPIKDFYGFTIE